MYHILQLRTCMGSYCWIWSLIVKIHHLNILSSIPSSKNLSYICTWILEIFSDILNVLSWYLHLMTDRAPHCAFLHRALISHFFTFLMSKAKFSGSDFMIWSNSANLPGRKNTFVKPNLKSFSFRPRALNRAWKKMLLWSHCCAYNVWGLPTLSEICLHFSPLQLLLT